MPKWFPMDICRCFMKAHIFYNHVPGRFWGVRVDLYFILGQSFWGRIAFAGRAFVRVCVRALVFLGDGAFHTFVSISCICVYMCIYV